MKRKWLGLFFVILISVAAVFYFYRQIYFSQGPKKENIVFRIENGEGISQIGKKLFSDGVISSSWYFSAYFFMEEKKIIYPGEYSLNGKMSIPEVVAIITNMEKKYEKVLFKEGWTINQMADELEVHGFSGKEFLLKAKNPSSNLNLQFDILKDKPEEVSLEGYLFPDTYYFSQDATADEIINKILSNTEKKINSQLRAEIRQKNKTVFEIMTIASIVEKEMAKKEEAGLIAGVFWNRIQNGSLLQSDATLTYVLGDKKDKHSQEELGLDSLYNTYKYKGLPPTPISNPGMEAILATINPEKSAYLFFLTIDDKNGKKTIFSKSFEEHVFNRKKYGI